MPPCPNCRDATSLDELMVEIRQAIELCLAVEGQESPSVEFVGIQCVTIAA